MLQRLPRLARLLAAVFTTASLAVLAAPADDLKEAQRLYNQGKLPQATEKVDAFLKAQPKDAQGRFLKGLLLTEQKKTAEAIQVFTGLTEDYPELPEPYNNLAVLYASQGNYDRAKSALELAIHTHPAYATAHENLGDIYAQLASRAYDRALQLDKNNQSAQVKLGMVKELFSKSGNAARAPQKPPEAPNPVVEGRAGSDQKVVAKAEPPKAEPKAEAPKAEPAKVSPAPPKAAPAKAEAAKPAAEPASGDKAAVTAAIETWARAWSAKDVKGYLAAYAPEFEVPGGEGRGAWEKQRTERIEKPKSIEVAVKVNSVAITGNEATAVIRQSYKSDTLKSNSTKTLKLLKSGDRWLIKQERVGG